MGAAPVAGTGGAMTPPLPVGGDDGSLAGQAGAGVAPSAGTGAAGMMPVAGMDGGDDPADDPEPGDEVPATAHCASVADWDPMWTQFEDEVLRLTNAARARGATCGDRGSFGPASPLIMNPSLRCSARLHSADMGEAGYFAHNSRDGTTPFARMTAAGYTGAPFGENIARGQQSPEQVVNGWMNSPGHCVNIMQASSTELGVGYWEGPAQSQWFNGNKLWTQNFGAPRNNCPWCR
jgi:uncharacterized protein YkwD